MNSEEAKKTVKEVFKKELPKPETLVARYNNADGLNAVHQADLLFLSTDPRYKAKYALVVTDIATRRVAARPLATKTSMTVYKALHNIYTTDEKLRPPHRLEVDPGSEFKGAVKAYLEKTTFIRPGIPGRHRQQGLVESVNRILGRAISIAQAERELTKGRTDKSWVKELPAFVEEINKRLERKSPPMPQSLPPPANDQDRTILDIGTEVRRILNEPQDVLGNKLSPSHSKTGLRAGDPTYETKKRRIVDLLLQPGMNPRYILEGLPNVSYARYELLV